MASISRSFRSMTKLKTNGPGSTKVEIRLASKPCDYVPGSGPPLQPLSILPPRDSTAYIIERILQPSAGLSASGKPMPKRMTYIVGWHDMPAARLLVPALEVLDYVSPQALEEWEWQLEMDLDEQRAKLEEERKARLNNNVPAPKKRGRPPAHTHTQIEAAAVAEPETEADAKKRRKRGAMSLSTPQKTASGDFAGLSDAEESPTRQLERELGLSSGDAGMEDLDMIDYDDGYGYEDDEMELVSTGELSAGGYLDGVSEGLGSHQLLPGTQPRTNPEFTAGNTPLASSRSSSAPQPPPLMQGLDTTHPNGQRSHKRQPSQLQSQLSQILDRSYPLHPEPNPAPSPWTEAARTSHLSEPRHETMTSSLNQMSMSKPAGRASRKPTSNEPTPKKTTSRTPKAKKPATQPAEETATTSETATEDAGPTWEVQRIEAVDVYEAVGLGQVRYFKVRWEGDWPEDQNPSWQPEADLPPDMVRKFLKKSRKARNAITRVETNQKLRIKNQKRKEKEKLVKRALLPWGQGSQYRSVSEAFAGDVVSDNAEEVPAELDETNGLDEDEELFVVEENHTPLGPSRVSWGGVGNGGTA